MEDEITAKVETDDTPYDIGYDPFEYESKDDYVKSMNAIVDAINATRE